MSTKRSYVFNDNPNVPSPRLCTRPLMNSIILSSIMLLCMRLSERASRSGFLCPSSSPRIKVMSRLRANPRIKGRLLVTAVLIYCSVSQMIPPSTTWSTQQHFSMKLWCRTLR